MKITLTQEELGTAVKEYFAKRNFKTTSVTFKYKNVFSHSDFFYEHYKTVGEVEAIVEPFALVAPTPQTENKTA